jgi:hypothetical protein
MDQLILWLIVIKITFKDEKVVWLESKNQIY